MGKKLIGACELCGRDDLELTVHHLTPKELGGTVLPTANVCIACTLRKYKFPARS